MFARIIDTPVRTERRESTWKEYQQQRRTIIVSKTSRGASTWLLILSTLKPPLGYFARAPPGRPNWLSLYHNVVTAARVTERPV